MSEYATILRDILQLIREIHVAHGRTGIVTHTSQSVLLRLIIMLLENGVLTATQGDELTRILDSGEEERKQFDADARRRNPEA